MRDKRNLARVLAVAILGTGIALVGGTAYAAEGDSPVPAGAENLDLSSIREMMSMRGERGEDGDDDKDFPPLKEVVEGMDHVSGFIDLYVDRKKDKVYALIPGKMVGKDFLLSSSMSRGNMQGFQWSDMMIRVERHDRSALIVMPDTFYTAEGKLKEVVENTYTNPVLATTKVMAEGGGGSILINLKDLLAGDAAAFVGSRPAASVTELAKAKAFPENIVVEFNFRSAQGTTGIYYSLNELPKSGYKPREADQRIGYFLTARKNFSADERADDTFERYINRWRVKKADPSLKLSPPEEPIVFYIEDTVPVKFRDAVREGIEDWNLAFEKVGISNAVVVRQQTDTQFADIDPEDARYNFIRWITSESAFAMGPSRVDPRTGEIFDADIIVDESMVRSYIRSFDLYHSTIASLSNLPPRVKQMLAQNPSMYPDWPRARVELAMRIESDEDHAGMTPEQLFSDMLVGGSDAHHDHRFCSIGQELQQELAFAQIALQYWGDKANRLDELKQSDVDVEEREKQIEEMKEAMEEAISAAEEAKESAEHSAEEAGEAADEAKEATKGDREKEDPTDEWPEEYISQLLKEVISHEVGHTLGLRHNYKASTWKSYEEIVNNDDPTVATIGSVMDYNPINLNADGSQPAEWITRTIGPYDYLAIEYGYAIPGSNGYPKGESKTLSKILEKTIEPQHVYATDEDVASPDPYINRFDMGSDPLDYVIAKAELADKILDDLVDVVIEDGESYSKLRQAYSILMWQRFSAASLAAKHIGGASVFRDVKGDGADRAPINVVSADVQRRALNTIVDMVLKEGAFKIDPEVQRYLAASRWSHRGSRDRGLSLTYPVQEDILSMQKNVLFSVLNPDRIQNVYDSEFRVSEDTDLLTLPELFDTVTKAVWSEVIDGKSGSFTVRKPMIDNLRRNLQRAYVARLIDIATQGESSYYPAIARTLAWKELSDLNEKIESAASGSGLDAYTVAHLEETNRRITNALDPEYTVGGAGGGNMIITIRGQEAGIANPITTIGDVLPHGAQ